jgi:hypothetical protein
MDCSLTALGWICPVVVAGAARLVMCELVDSAASRRGSCGCRGSAERAIEVRTDATAAAPTPPPPLAPASTWPIRRSAISIVAVVVVGAAVSFARPAGDVSWACTTCLLQLPSLLQSRAFTSLVRASCFCVDLCSPHPHSSGWHTVHVLQGSGERVCWPEQAQLMSSLRGRRCARVVSCTVAQGVCEPHHLTD